MSRTLAMGQDELSGTRNLVEAPFGRALARLLRPILRSDRDNQPRAGICHTNRLRTCQRTAIDTFGQRDARMNSL